jgi:hypothetical protein
MYTYCNNIHKDKKIYIIYNNHYFHFYYYRLIISDWIPLNSATLTSLIDSMAPASGPWHVSFARTTLRWNLNEGIGRGYGHGHWSICDSYNKCLYMNIC